MFSSLLHILVKLLPTGFKKKPYSLHKNMTSAEACFAGIKQPDEQQMHNSSFLQLEKKCVWNHSCTWEAGVANCPLQLFTICLLYNKSGLYQPQLELLQRQSRSSWKNGTTIIL